MYAQPKRPTHPKKSTTQHANANIPPHPPLAMEYVLLGGLIASGILGYKLYGIKKMTAPCPGSGPVPENKIRICVAGSLGPHDARAHKIAATIAAAYPDQYV